MNPLEAVPEACHKDERKFHVKPVRQKWFGCACCPPNLARLLSSIGSYAFTEKEDTLFVHLYMGSVLTKKAGGRDVDVCLESGFPWDGNVKIKVRAKDTGFTLACRIPDWCDGYTVKGIDGAQTEEKNGYLYVKKEWGEEDCIELSFPMEAKLISADGRVREDAGKAAVVRGPIIYCAEEADNGKDLHLLTLCPDAAPVVKETRICGVPVKTVEAAGYRQVREEAAGLYHPYRPAVKEAVQIRLIPYFAWANRGENEMQVWTRVEEKS